MSTADIFFLRYFSKKGAVKNLRFLQPLKNRRRFEKSDQSDNLIGIEDIFGVERAFDAAHYFDLRRAVLFRHNRFFCVAYAVFARDEASEFVTFAVHTLERYREFFLKLFLG